MSQQQARSDLQGDPVAEENRGPDHRPSQPASNWLSYVDIVVRRWYVPAACILLVLIGLSTYLNLQTDVYEAASGVAIIRSRTEVIFEPNIKTITEDSVGEAGDPRASLAQVTAEQAARRQTLLALVNNATIAQAVVEKLGSQLPEQLRQPGSLNAMVYGRLAQNPGERDKSDLIQIAVRHPDPRLAATIANTWAESYEQLVNETYGGLPGNVTAAADTTASKEAYEQAQVALTGFIAENRAGEATRKIGEVKATLDVLEQARQQLLHSTISQTITSKNEIVDAYLAAEMANRILVFNKEQERNRSLVAAYLDAQSKTETDLFNAAFTDRLRTLTDAYADKARVEHLLRQARALRDESRQGGSASSATLALLLLKSEAYAGGATIPATLDLRVESVSDLTPGNYQADAEAIVAGLEARLADAEAKIKEQSSILLAAQGLVLPEAPSQEELTAAIQQRYPTLFEIGDLTKMAELVSASSPLKTARESIAAEVVQLSDALGVLKGPAATQLNATIEELNAQLRGLQAQVEEDSARHGQLTIARDIALNTYTTLARKASEIGVAEQLPGTEVRFAASAPIPVSPLPKPLGRWMLLAPPLVFVVTSVLVVLYELLRRNRRAVGTTSSAVIARGSRAVA